ncbi:disease resistance protein L6-like [Rhodamnia argentea]|uniref:Disease resistance protein L6-like n=1 Tax=Rhodamnia argentea TaxID=178133 RepID=A0ABM3HCU9_9MYRT|nr:disease resistance protein L6-like [Rhodamnia argentea]
MANSEAGTSSDNPLGVQYQVFLSFRGPDTRCGFANTLCHGMNDAGIRVFMDDEELRPGERISEELLRAIDKSKSYMPIFSKNYASSHWCLRELAKMVENTSESKEDGNKKVIFPIFYNVKTDDVKSNTGLYSKAISELEQKMVNQKRKVSTEEVEKWRRALQKVGGIQGWELEKYDGDGHLSVSVVEEVVRKLHTRQRKVIEDLVGMEDRIAAMNNLLDMDSGDVRLVGIWGMGGTGKTTLARIIFNELCPRFGKNCSFLADVRETAKTKGLNKLREQLLSDLSCSRGARNIVDTEDTICSKKVLIVLDDIDDSDQIRDLIGVKSLCSGTRIIVTTREKNVLNIRGFKYKSMPYDMEGLSDKDALQLFSRHAFDVDSPPPDYFTLSKNIVSTTGGLPLALRAIGKMLFSIKEKNIWEEKLEKLSKIPHHDVLGMLQITYDTLEWDEQQIFLDIACLFIDFDKINPIYMWKACGFSANSAITVLIDRSMIKVLDNNTFWMHDQFIDLGRTISSRECSRLWAPDDIIRELRSTEINTSVQALYCKDLSLMGVDKHITVTSEQIKRFPSLWLLRLGNITYQGDFTGCLFELKWINLAYDYRSSFAATNLNPENVVVMEIFGHGMSEDAVISLVEGAKKLKALTLENIRSLHRTPTFSQNSVLEKLTFHHCEYLKEIDFSIGELTSPTHLIIFSSEELEKLPEQIGKLENLQHLSLLGCQRLRELPDSVSKLKSLTNLNVACTGITGLPDSIDRLQSLSSLYLYYCHQIQELPKLPESLTTLLFESESLRTVPDLSNLTNLVELLLSDGSEFNGKSNMIRPCNLPWIGGLSKPRKLDLCLLNVHTTSADWASLTLLEELTLKGLDLQKLEQLPSNLRVLELDNTRVEELELDELRRLEELTIRGCEPVKRLSIPSSLRKSRDAEVSSCNKLVEVQLLGVLESMENLRISECKSLERLVCLSSSLEEAGWNELQAPELSDGGRRVSLFSSSLRMLQRLIPSTCPELHEIQFVSALESLKAFVVRECISLKRIGGSSNLKNLEDLEFGDCESLRVVRGINELERLGRLQFYRCRSMGKIIDASSSKIPNECWIDIEDCGELPGTGPSDSTITWKRYREKILNAVTQASDSGPSERQDYGDEDDDKKDDGKDDNEEDDEHEDHENDDGEDDEVNNVHSSRGPSPDSSMDDNDENDDVDKEFEGEADRNSYSKDDEDDDHDHNEEKNEHEVLQLSHGPPPFCLMGDNDENNDVNEEGKGDSNGDEERIRKRTRKRKRGTMKMPKRSDKEDNGNEDDD